MAGELFSLTGTERAGILGTRVLDQAGNPRSIASPIEIKDRRDGRSHGPPVEIHTVRTYNIEIKISVECFVAEFGISCVVLCFTKSLIACVTVHPKRG